MSFRISEGSAFQCLRQRPFSSHHLADPKEFSSEMKSITHSLKKIQIVFSSAKAAQAEPIGFSTLFFDRMLQIPAEYRSQMNVHYPEGKFILNEGDFEGKELQLKKILSKGRYGYVFQGEISIEEDVIPCAVKMNQLSLRGDRSESQMFKKSIENEFRVLHRLQATPEVPIVQALHFQQIAEQINMIVLPLYQYNLQEYVKMFPESFTNINCTMRIASQMFNALQILEQRQVIHRDIKLENVLIESIDPIQVKLADFGVAKHSPYLNESGKEAVSLQYRPPEVIFKMPYDTRVDVWSVGCLLFEVQFQHPFFPGLTEGAILSYQQSILGGIPSSFLQRIRTDFSWSMDVMQISQCRPPFIGFIHHIGSKIDAILPGIKKEEFTPIFHLLERMMRWEPLERASVDELKDLCTI